MREVPKGPREGAGKRHPREKHCDRRRVSKRQGDRALAREIAERGGKVYRQDLGSRQPQGRRLGSYRV